MIQEIERKIYPKLLRYLEKKEIIALIGSRQVGKTTLMKKLFKSVKFKKKIFISFDEETILNQFENNFEDFIEVYVKNYDYLFIDEFQYAKGGGKRLKLIFDKYGTKIIISGSSAPELSIETLGYLVGRVFIFEIFPISFEEYIKFKDKNLLTLYQKNITNKNLPLFEKHFQEFLIYGSYPQIIVENLIEDKIMALKSLVDNYLLREIKDILSYKSSNEFENLLKILAISDTTLLNKSNISSDLGLHINKVTEMINILKNTYILKVLNSFQIKKIKELVKAPKTYFWDLGFKNILMNNFNTHLLRVDKGAILESFILLELLKKNLEVKFYNYKNSSEVDFLLEFDAKKIAVEVKSNLTGMKVERGLRVYIEKYNPDFVYIFNLNIEGEMKIGNSKIIFLHHLNIGRLFN